MRNVPVLREYNLTAVGVLLHFKRSLAVISDKRYT